MIVIVNAIATTAADAAAAATCSLIFSIVFIALLFIHISARNTYTMMFRNSCKLLKHGHM